MAHDFPPDTKFAAFHLCHCFARGLPDVLPLSNELSAHSAPVLDLTDLDKDWLGRDRADAFDHSIVLVASMPSETAGILDAESRHLEHLGNRLFYGLLMQGIPEFWHGIVALGSRQGTREPWANSLIMMARYYRHPHAMLFHVTPEALRLADAVVPGLIDAFPGGPNVAEFAKLRRGVRALEVAWRAERALDRIHMFVRALDGLMKLEQGAGEQSFVDRTTMIASGQRIEDVAREIYRLRSHNEHLSDWPSKLGYVREPDQPEFVSRRAFYAEVLVGEAYRRVLSEPNLRTHFRTDDTIEAFWRGGAAAWTPSIDLDAHARRFQFTLM